MNSPTDTQFPDLVTPLYEAAQRRISGSRSPDNRASQLGGDCERRLVYYRTHGEQAALPDVHTKLIFEEGSLHEEDLKIKLAQAGVRFILTQQPLVLNEYQITGTIDGAIIHGDPPVAVPVDIKSASENVWRQMAPRGPGCYEFSEVQWVFDRRPWLRCYPAQIMLYAAMKGCDRGILLFKNKTSGALAQINVPIDRPYVEGLFRRAKRINEHVANGTLPDRIPFDEKVCPRCPFYALCLPGYSAGPPIAYVSDEDATAKLEEWARAEPDHKVYEDLTAWIREWAWAKYPDTDTVALVGWLIEKKKSRSGARLTSIRRLSDALATTEGDD